MFVLLCPTCFGHQTDHHQGLTVPRSATYSPYVVFCTTLSWRVACFLPTLLFVPLHFPLGCLLRYVRCTLFLKSLKLYLHYSALHVSDTTVPIIRSFSVAHAVSGPYDLLYQMVAIVLCSFCLVFLYS